MYELMFTDFLFMLVLTTPFSADRSSLCTGTLTSKLMYDTIMGVTKGQLIILFHQNKIFKQYDFLKIRRLNQNNFILDQLTYQILLLYISPSILEQQHRAYIVKANLPIKSHPIEHTLPTYRLINCPVLYKPTQAKQIIAFGYDSNYMKLRQGENINAKTVTASKVSIMERKMIIIMKGILITSRIDRMKFKQRQSFKDTAKWLQQTRNYANQKISLLLVGNKCDLQQKREVSTQEGSTFAESNKMIFMECSAKDHQLTQEAFLRLAKEVLRKIEHHQIDPKNQQHGIKLGNMGKTNKKQAIRLCCFW